MDPQDLASQLRKIADSIDATEKPDKQVIAGQIKIALDEIGPAPAPAPSPAPESSPLHSVLSLLGAAGVIHQTSHWKVSGPQYYADHLLLQRVYEGIDIDGIGERIMGIGGDVCPVALTQAIGSLVNQLAPQSDDPEALMSASLNIERAIIETITAARGQLEQAGQLTDGIDNMLQGISDAHEVFIYLLQQRLK